MKTYNKNTFVHKLRAYLIILLGIFQLVHYIALLNYAKTPELNRVIWYLIIFTIVFTILEIKNDFSIMLKNGLVIQIVGFAMSLHGGLVVFGGTKIIAIAIVEMIIIGLGIFRIYWNIYIK